MEKNKDIKMKQSSDEQINTTQKSVALLPLAEQKKLLKHEFVVTDFTFDIQEDYYEIYVTCIYWMNEGQDEYEDPKFQIQAISGVCPDGYMTALI